MSKQSRYSLIGFAVLTLGLLGSSAALASGVAQVEKVRASREGEIFTADLQLKGDFSSPEVQAQFANETVQVDLPGVALGKGKFLTRVDDRLVKSVYVTQPDGGIVRAKIILKMGFLAKSIENQVRISKRAGGLTIEILGDAQRGVAKNETESVRVVAVGDADQQSEDAAFPTKLVADGSAAAAGVEGATSGDKATLPGEGESAPIAEKKPDTNKLPENQIPVLTKAEGEKKEAGSSLPRLLITLGVLAVVLGATSFGVKRWASKSQGKNQNTRIKVLTQHHLGPKKSLAIIQVAGESILIGMTDQNISMLKTLSLLDDEIPEATPSNFDHALADFDEDDEDDISPRGKKGRGRKKESEDFAMRGLAEIRDVVSSRLKNFKNLE